MFSKKDFQLSETENLAEFCLIIPFVMLIAPFLFLAYQIGLVQAMLGFLDKP